MDSRQSFATVLRSSNELDELLQRYCHEDSTMIILMRISAIISITVHETEQNGTRRFEIRQSMAVQPTVHDDGEDCTKHISMTIRPECIIFPLFRPVCDGRRRQCQNHTAAGGDGSGGDTDWPPRYTRH